MNNVPAGAARRAAVGPHRVSEADRAAWRVWAADRAQEAFRRGSAAADQGQPQDALRWLERARRLAPDAAHVTFPLAIARLGCGDAPGAIRLLQPLMERFDFREGWMMLAAAQRAARLPAEAARSAARGLARHAPDQAVLPLLTDVAQTAGWPGWCGLSSSGQLHLGLSNVEAGGPGPSSGRRKGARQPVVVLLDGQKLPTRTRGGVTMLAGPWIHGRRLAVTRDGQPLLGSPLDIGAILRVEGFVEVRDGQLTGWVWHPGEPERTPVVTVQPIGTDRRPRGRPVEAAMVLPTEGMAGEMPLARPRRLGFEAGTLVPAVWDGPLRVLGSDGRDLSGSPLDPGLERRAAASVSRLQARFSTGDRYGRPAAERHEPLPPFLPVSARLVGVDPAVGRAVPVDVVVPVYRHLRRTLDCLHSLFATIPDTTRVVVVDDASPDPAMAEALDALAQAGRIVLVRHIENRGFPTSANDGIVACAGRDVILLNSDTLVATGWLEALRRAAYSAPEIGTATPFSNEASILNYPDHRAPNKAPDLAGTRRLMELAAAANAGAVCDIPTGNGFCLYLRRDCLDQVGLLREDLFAQGYGEENDFCLRARHLGWRNVAALGVYVAHHGSVSFGSARTELMRRNLGVLNHLHPGYDLLIAEHIEADPLAPARRRIDLARWQASRRASAVLLITHDQGGGVERVVQERARRLRAQGIRPIVLRPDRYGGGVVLSDAGLEETFPNLRYGLPDEMEALVALLKGERVLHAEWHHLLGHHAAIRALCNRLAVPYDAFVHDYAWFCQRIALVGPQGRYCGEPDIKGCEACIAIQGSALSEEIGMPALLARSAAELRAARQVIAPSQDAAHRIRRHFPAIRAIVEPWEDDRPDLSLERLAAASGRPGTHRPEAGEPRRARVVIIGGIGREKGYDVLLDCLADVARRQLPLDFVVVGHTPDDRALMDAGCLFVTGDYREDEAIALIHEQEADLALLPSIWPETWCFTLSLAWRAGLSTAVFDIGAQAERVRQTRRGVALPLGLPVTELNTLLLRLARSG